MWTYVGFFVHIIQSLDITNDVICYSSKIYTEYLPSTNHIVQHICNTKSIYN